MKKGDFPLSDRLGLSREEAAAYIGVGATLFDEMVDDCRMPKPKLINARRVWSRMALEKAFGLLPEEAQENDTSSDPWANVNCSAN
jgi:predicted DNA-binding transcriptional regulator AlpA